jgi:hypothetical protein
MRTGSTGVVHEEQSDERKSSVHGWLNGMQMRRQVGEGRENRRPARAADGAGSLSREIDSQRRA